MEESGGRNAIRVQSKSNSGDNYTGSVRGFVRRSGGFVADFRRSNSALWSGGFGLDARRSSHRRLCHGAERRLSATDATGREKLCSGVSPVLDMATIVFGLSTALWLSLAMLFLIGALDSVSVIIRGSIVQLVTPDEMRGRVSAVNNIFIGTSNEFGALESGLTAALFGPVISVAAGGIGTILVCFRIGAEVAGDSKIGRLDKTLQASEPLET